MDWLKRYVDNVKTYLPANMRDDIGNELYSDLQDQVEDMEQSRGTPLAEDEILALLKEKGHPMQVAAGYQPRKTLVSEALFPLYALVLKWVLLAIFIANGVITLLSVLPHQDPNLLQAVISWLAGTFNGGLQGFAWVTLGFYLAGESISYSNAFGKWDPSKLPAIADANQGISQFESAVELVVTLIFMAWLNDMFAILIPASEQSAQFSFSPELLSYLPWLNLALGANILMALYKLVSPYWTKAKLLIDTVFNLYWLVLLATLFSIQNAFEIHWINNAGENWAIPTYNWQALIGIIFVITAYDVVKNVRRYMLIKG